MNSPDNCWFRCTGSNLDRNALYDSLEGRADEGASRRVILIDDPEDNELREMLRKLGYAVTEYLLNQVPVGSALGEVECLAFRDSPKALPEAFDIVHRTN